MKSVASFKISLFFVAFFLFNFFLSSVYAGVYSGGDGSAENPFQIATPNDLNSIGKNLNDRDKYFIMTNDIDLSGFTGSQFNIIGQYTNTSFKGVFDGNGHSISNFTYSTNEEVYVGLFGLVDNTNALIKNIRLVNPHVYSNHSMTGGGVGSLVGLLKYGVVSSCCSVGGEVSGDWSIGGLIGDNWNGIVLNCYASTNATDYGGFGNGYVGGLAGDSGGQLYHCYSTGIVNGGYRRGGLLGDSNSKIFSCFWDVQTSGTTNGVGNVNPDPEGVIGKTTVQMQDENTFLSQGWDFIGEYQNGPSEIWAEPLGGGYMVLWHQLSSLPSLPVFSGGNGESNDPYLIASADDLNKIGYNPRLMKKHYRLVENIDLDGVDFFSIGNPGERFTGILDGNDYSISKLTIDTNTIDYVGLFNYVEGSNSEIKNLILIDPIIEVGKPDYAGSLVGRINHGKVDNCHAFSGSVTADKSVGGLISTLYFATVQNCSSSADVLGAYPVGGLVAESASSSSIRNCSTSSAIQGDGTVGGLLGANGRTGNITNCHSSGDTIGIGIYVGGLVGFNRGVIRSSFSTGTVTGNTIYVGGLIGYSGDGDVSNSYSLASVSGGSYTGGLIGGNDENTVRKCFAKGDVNVSDSSQRAGALIGTSNDSNIQNCYATGNVSTAPNCERIGGLIGYTEDCTVTNCYATGYASGQSYNGGLIGKKDTSSILNSFWNSDTGGPDNGIGLARTTYQMQSESTFTSVGWDFINETDNGTEDIWRMCIDGIIYPKLTWQLYNSADFLCPDRVDFLDLSYLATQWMQTDCIDSYNCYGTDLDRSGFVGSPDIRIFCELWLSKTLYIPGDFLPPDGVDFLDYGFFADHWMHIDCNDVNDCNSTDLDFSGEVGPNDLDIFTNYWLFGKQ